MVWPGSEYGRCPRACQYAGWTFVPMDRSCVDLRRPTFPPAGGVTARVGASDAPCCVVLRRTRGLRVARHRRKAGAPKKAPVHVPARDLPCALRASHPARSPRVENVLRLRGPGRPLGERALVGGREQRRPREAGLEASLREGLSRASRRLVWGVPRGGARRPCAPEVSPPRYRRHLSP